MRFYSLVSKLAYQNQDVLNVWWYRLDAIGLPTAADLAELAAGWETTCKPAYRAMLANNVVLTQIIVQGYNEDFGRVPYNPLILDRADAGTLVGAAGHPMQCAILTARVEPQRDGYRLQTTGQITRSPVRRGYMAISGILDAWMLPTGFLDPAFISSPMGTNMVTAFKASVNAAGFAGDYDPIRVSQPPKDTNLRGYGLIVDARWSPYVSARRSRKVGQGAR